MVKQNKTSLNSPASAILFWCLLLILLDSVLSHAKAQMPSWWGRAGSSVMTCRGDDDTEFVLVLLDTRSRSQDAPNSFDWVEEGPNPPAMYHAASWTRANLGAVFGIALDATHNIYLTSSVAFGLPFDRDGNDQHYGPAGSGGIYKIDASTGAISVFAVIPQDQTVVDRDGTPITATGAGTRVGAGLGQITYDYDHNQFFVSSFDDGKIYRLSAAGAILDSYDPLLADPSPTDTGPNDPIPPLGDRPWALGYYGGRLYYSNWVDDRGAPDPINDNEIRSVALNANGTWGAATTDQLEFTLPRFAKDGASPTNESHPVSDIEFNDVGDMLTCERGREGDTIVSSHRTRVLLYERTPGGSYPSVPTNDIRIGTAPNNDNGSTDGGVDWTYDSYDSSTGDATGNLTWMWSTGHRLRESGDDGGTKPSGYSGTYKVAGLQASPVNQVVNGSTFWQISNFLDLDGTGSVQKTQQGDVDVVRGFPIVCSVDSVQVTPGVCNDNGTPNDTTDDYYTASVTVNYTNPPTTGTLDLIGDALHSTNTVNSVPVSSIGATSYTFTGVRIKADGAAHSFTAIFQ